MMIFVIKLVIDNNLKLVFVFRRDIWLLKSAFQVGPVGLLTQCPLVETELLVVYAISAWNHIVTYV